MPMTDVPRGVCEKVTKALRGGQVARCSCPPAARMWAAGDRAMNSQYIYQGYVFADVSTRTEDGRYRARVAIISIDGMRTRSKRVIQLDVHPTQEAALGRLTAAAKTWIESETDKDRLSLPTNFSGLQ